MRRDVGKRMSDAGSGLAGGGWEFRGFQDGFSCHWRIHRRFGDAGTRAKCGVERCGGIRNGKRGGSTYCGERNGGSRGLALRILITPVVRVQSVRHVGGQEHAGHGDLGRNAARLTDGQRRRRGHAGPVRSELPREWLLVRGELLLIRVRIGKGRRRRGLRCSW